MTESTDLSEGRGWLLVGIIIGALIGIPTLIWYLTIGMGAGYGIYVAVAMLPGLIFGGIGVWTALRHRR